MPWSESKGGERLARVGLIVAMAISASLILIAGRDSYFWADELNWLIEPAGSEVQSVLTPHASHLIAIPRVTYEGLPQLFGVDYLPFRVLAVGILLTCAGLVFVLLQRRVGAPLALAPTVVLLFFGSAQETFTSPLGIPFTLAIAFGLGALVAVERNDIRGELLATVLLTLAILSHTFGTIVAIGVAVYFAMDHGRRREIWVALLPLALWLIWWLWARQFDQGITSGTNLLGAPFFAIEAAGAAIEAAIGLGPLLGGRLNFVLGLLGLGLLGYRFVRGGVGPWLYAYTAIAIAFWLGLGLAESDQREPSTPRYAYFGAIMIYLIAGESLRGIRVSTRAIPYLAAAFLVALVGNAGRLPNAFEDTVDRGAVSRAQIAAVQLGEGVVDPTLLVRELGPPASDLIAVPSARLVEFRESVGDLGFTPEELRAQPEEIRLGADFVLIRGIGARTVEVPRRDGPKRGDCVVHRPGADGYTTFDLMAGGSLIELIGDTGEPGAELLLGRFADASVPIGTLEEGTEAVMLLPEDDAPDPWLATASGRIRVCSVVA